MMMIEDEIYAEVVGIEVGGTAEVVGTVFFFL